MCGYLIRVGGTFISGDKKAQTRLSVISYSCSTTTQLLYRMTLSARRLPRSFNGARIVSDAACVIAPLKQRRQRQCDGLPACDEDVTCCPGQCLLKS